MVAQFRGDLFFYFTQGVVNELGKAGVRIGGGEQSAHPVEVVDNLSIISERVNYTGANAREVARNVVLIGGAVALGVLHLHGLTNGVVDLGRLPVQGISGGNIETVVIGAAVLGRVGGT